MARLSVTIVTLDEERDLPGCLASVAFADEIVVVDSGSKDRTREIAASAGARVFENPWPGDAPQKSFAMQHASGEWILNLDADERCSEALRAALPGLLARSDVEGFDVLFENHLFERRARFGGLGGERHLRLFRKASATYQTRQVHGGATVAGRVERLDAPIVHHPYASLEEYFDKFNRYTSHLAKEKAMAGRRFSPLAVLRWPWGFFRRYVLRLGFLDGYAGFLHAALSGLYDFVKVAKIDDLEREARRLEGRRE